MSCNLSDGVILGVDSAASVPTPQGIAKVYENAEKLFQLGERPVGVAIYGLGSIAGRSIGSHLREFEVRNPKNLDPKTDMATVVEALREFFMSAYTKEIVPQLEAQSGKKFDQLAPNEIAPLGLVVGGFSQSQYLSEVWEILIPQHKTKGSAACRRKQGAFGCDWFAMFDPIRRYIKGFQPELVDGIADYLVNARGGQALTDDEKLGVRKILQGFEYPIPFGAMPMQEGVNHVRFLVELVINHHRFAVGAPVVGGKVQIGKVTYRGEKFEILEEEVH